MARANRLLNESWGTIYAFPEMLPKDLDTAKKPQCDTQKLLNSKSFQGARDFPQIHHVDLHGNMLVWQQILRSTSTTSHAFSFINTEGFLEDYSQALLLQTKPCWSKGRSDPFSNSWKSHLAFGRKIQGNPEAQKFAQGTLPIRSMRMD